MDLNNLNISPNSSWGPWQCRQVRSEGELGGEGGLLQQGALGPPKAVSGWLLLDIALRFLLLKSHGLATSIVLHHQSSWPRSAMHRTTLRLSQALGLSGSLALLKNIN